MKHAKNTLKHFRKFGVSIRYPLLLVSTKESLVSKKRKLKEIVFFGSPKPEKNKRDLILKKS